jgi:hypothetical protein
VIKEAYRQKTENQGTGGSPEPHVLMKEVNSKNNARENEAHDGLKRRLRELPT